jgi:hypothetical protein
LLILFAKATLKEKTFFSKIGVKNIRFRRNVPSRHIVAMAVQITIIENHSWCLVAIAIRKIL